MNFKSLETKRLLLREFNQNDFPYIHAYASDSEVSKFLHWGPNSEEDTKKFLRDVIEYQSNNPRYDYEIAVILKENNTLIGACSIHVSNPKNREGWIGYCYNQQYWGRGYASEAASAIVKYGFENLNLHRIFATCSPDNYGSARVLEKIGMKKEGLLREHKWHKGGWRDSFVFSVLEDEL